MQPWNTPELRHRLDLALESHRHWTGRDLVPGLPPPGSDARYTTLWSMPRVLVSHGIQDDPVFWYGNRAALELWELDWEAFTRTPSRYTAEAPLRDERARLLERVTRHGFIDDYSGVRISRTGKRFRIGQAVVWNLRDERGARAGQAASFTDWEPLPMKTAAILGASADPAKFGHKAVLAYARQGHGVWPVNPKEAQIAGHPAFRDLASLPGRPDVISVYLPPPVLLGVLPAIAARGCDELWLNPGTDSPEVVAEAERLGLPVIRACSIVGLGLSPSQLGV
ncbi:MAG: MEKHLA domain-containing protein [Verrucomicrobiota bacterium]